MVDPNTALAMAALADARVSIRAARIDASTAAARLTGPQHIRAQHLADTLAAVLADTESLRAAVQAAVP